MKKFCVFCGKQPNQKNKEHVIPRWLIELSGDPKRNIHLGLLRGQGGEKTFAFDQFQFPSCTQCNSNQDKLEATARTIILALLSGSPIDVKQTEIFLNWLDKIRIGLWLGYIYLNENRFGIDPKFFISSRICKSDRMAAIYHVYGQKKSGVNFFGIQTPVFQFQPSCFMLRINHLYILNMSDAFLFSARLGFPYMVSGCMDKNGRFDSITMASGHGFAKHPLIRHNLISPAIDFYQPILPNQFRDYFRTCYEQSYVKDNCLDFICGTGAIFRQFGGKVLRWKDPIETSALSHPQFQYNSREYWEMIGQTFKFQNYLADGNDPVQLLDPTEQAQFKKERKIRKTVNNILLRRMMKNIEG